MCAGNARAWANQELQQGDVAVVGLQARVIGASIESIDPRHLAGVPEGPDLTCCHKHPQYDYWRYRLTTSPFSDLFSLVWQ